MNNTFFSRLIIGFIGMAILLWIFMLFLYSIGGIELVKQNDSLLNFLIIVFSAGNAFYVVWNPFKSKKEVKE